MQFFRKVERGLIAPCFTDTFTDSGQSALHNFFSFPALELVPVVGLELMRDLSETYVNPSAAETSLNTALVTTIVHPLVESSQQLPTIPCNP